MSVFDDLMDQGYTEDEIESILALGGFQEEFGSLEKEREKFEDYASPGIAQGRQVGQIYQAAHPLEHLANMLRTYQGQKKLGEVKSQREDLLKRQQQARSQFLRNRGGATAPSPMGMSGGTGGYTGGWV